MQAIRCRRCGSSENASTANVEVAIEVCTDDTTERAVTIRKLAQASPGPTRIRLPWIPATHLVYLSLASVGGHPVLRELTPP